MNIKIDSLSKSLGTLVSNNYCQSIFQVHQGEVIALFRQSSLLLFRGFEVDVLQFKSFTNSFSTSFATYVGGAYGREEIKGDKTVLSVTGGKQTFAVPLHAEMYYKKRKPEMMWFYCAMPPVQDGETTVCDGIAVYNQLSSSTQDLLSNKKIKYIRTYKDGSWQQIYQTDDLTVLESVCKDNDLSLKVNPDQSITTEYICPAIVSSRDGKDKAFLNNILPVVAQERQGHKASIVRFEDDSLIPNEVIAEIQEVTSRLTVAINWQKGDVLMLDNRRLLHGRKAFADTKRDIYVRLCEPSFSV